MGEFGSSRQPSGRSTGLATACKVAPVFRARLLTWLFAVLLLGMQQTSQLHALSHLGGLFVRPHEQGLQVPVSDTPCLLCELSAGGSAATAADVQALPNVAPPFTATWVTTASPAPAAPAPYLSRAPPTLL